MKEQETQERAFTFPDVCSGAVKCVSVGPWLTWDGVRKSVRVFGYECVLDVSSTHSMGSWQTHTQSVSEVRQTWRQTSSCSAATLGTTHLTKLVFSSWKQGASPPLHMWQGLVGRTLDVRERKRVRGCGVCWDRQQSEGSRESEGTSCTTEPSTHLITTWWRQEEVG